MLFAFLSCVTAAPLVGRATPCTYTVVNGDNCWAVANANGLTVAQLQSFNPALSSSCSLTVGQALNLTVTTVTIASGDYCYKIATANSLTTSQLSGFNPSLSCDSMQPGQVWAVSSCGQSFLASQSTPTTTATTIAASGTGSKSSASGKQYTVVNGDSCWSIASANGLTLAQLQSANPQLNSNCDLTIGQVLCVSTSCSSTTTASVVGAAASTTSAAATGGAAVSYTVKSGDYCSAIASSNGITQSQLLANNPSINSDCTNLQVGQVLCIKNCASATVATTTTAATTVAAQTASASGTVVTSTGLTPPSTVGRVSPIKGVVRTGNTGITALTLDDGVAQYNREAVDYLLSQGVRATYFINLNNYECIYTDTNIANLRYALSKGSEIGIHTASHFNVSAYGLDALQYQLDLCEKAIWKILGVTPSIFRAPYGAITDAQVSYLNNQRGYAVVGWDVDDNDSMGATVAQSENLLLQAVQNDIMLAHEVKQATVEQVLPYVIPKLIAKGLKLGTIAEALNIVPYQSVGGPTNQKPDSTWTCANLPAPGAPK